MNFCLTFEGLGRLILLVKDYPGYWENWPGAGSITYNATIIDLGNFVNITTGIFTVPISGWYYLSWSGPNGELIPRPDASWCQVNNEQWGRGSWEDGRKTRNRIQLKQGDKVCFRAYLRADWWPKQYKRWVGYYIGAF